MAAVGRYSVNEPGLALVLNYALQLQRDPALDGRWNEAVALMIRPGAMVYDASGELGDEKITQVIMTRTQLLAMLTTADSMWFDDCAVCRWHPSTGKPLSKFNPWRMWCGARRASFNKAAPKWAQRAADYLTWRVAR